MALWLTLVWIAGMTTASGGAAPADLQPAQVVVELFTSQGCSSCPPADALWRRLEEEPALRGRVVPLAFHVDYWDSLGWKDPFSNAAWSARQNDYARAFGSDRIYTPQAVIGGRSECVGSDEDEVLAHVEAATHRPLGRLAVRRIDAASLAVTAVPPDSARRPLEVLVAVFEREHTTAVERGENGGRKLQNAVIVRSLEPAFTLAPSAPPAAEHIVPLRLDPAWTGLRLGVAVFLQDPKTREIFGGRAIDL
ncbi:MAG TPA: DUF1223 domain-containing protein [Vicinamibacterales bacterium]|nr:DUF1223 domain-containing protein [Vicinamibacterales bacterium]